MSITVRRLLPPALPSHHHSASLVSASKFYCVISLFLQRSGRQKQHLRPLWLSPALITSRANCSSKGSQWTTLGASTGFVRDHVWHGSAKNPSQKVVMQQRREKQSRICLHVVLPAPPFFGFPRQTVSGRRCCRICLLDRRATATGCLCPINGRGQWLRGCRGCWSPMSCCVFGMACVVVTARDVNGRRPGLGLRGWHNGDVHR